MAWLSTGAYLVVNKFLVSDNGLYYAIMQGDGNFVLYHGSPSNPGPAYWATNTAQSLGQYFAIMQSDGNFVLYRGTDPAHQAGFVWNSGVVPGQGQYFATMQNDGNFVVYRGSDPAHQGSFVWNTGISYNQATVGQATAGQVTVHNQGGYVAQCDVIYTLGGQVHQETSDNLNLGQSFSVTIPSGAINVKVICRENTGFSWVTIFEGTFSTSIQKTFTLTGTTLNPDFHEG